MKKNVYYEYEINARKISGETAANTGQSPQYPKMGLSSRICDSCGLLSLIWPSKSECAAQTALSANRYIWNTASPFRLLNNNNATGGVYGY